MGLSQWADGWAEFSDLYKQSAAYAGTKQLAPGQLFGDDQENYQQLRKSRERQRCKRGKQRFLSQTSGEVRTRAPTSSGDWADRLNGLERRTAAATNVHVSACIKDCGHT